MATRMYFRENGTVPITPAVDAGWESSASPFARKPMFTTTDAGDTLTTVAGFTSTTAQDRCHRQFISLPMAAGIVFDTSVTYKCYVQVLEGASTDNVRSRLGMRILSRDGSTVRATPLAILDYSTAAEWGTALRNKAFANGDLGVSSYTTVAGDRLVVEIGHNDVAGTTPEGRSRWGSAGSADLGENETSTSTTERPWFETSVTITFETLAVPTRYFLRNLTPLTPPSAGEKSTALPVGSVATGGGDYALDTAIGTSQFDATVNTLAQTSHQDVFHTRFTSEPLASQVIPPGALTFAGRFDGDTNARFTFSVYAWRPSTAAVVGYLYDSDEPLAGPGTCHVMVFARAEVTLVDGDVLVLEVWEHALQSNADSQTYHLYFNDSPAATEGWGSNVGAYLELVPSPAPRAMHSYRQRRVA